MASFDELVALNNEGDLGNMLAISFNGEIWHTYLRKDSELIISFKSITETPSREEIDQAVTWHYRRLGYIVEPSTRPQIDVFECCVFCDRKCDGFITVLITTFYPLNAGNEHNHLRVTTTVCC